MRLIRRAGQVRETGVNPPRSRPCRWTRQQRGRVRVALLACAVLVVAPAVAVFGARILMRGQEVSRAVQAVDGPSQEIPADVSGLLFDQHGFEVIGISQDHRVIGLNTTRGFNQVVMLVDRGMRDAGWDVRGSGQEGVMSCVRGAAVAGKAGQDRKGATAGQVPSYALVVIQDLGASRSVVVQFA